MEKWRRSLQHAMRDVGELARKFDLDADRLAEVTANFGFQVSPYYLSLIERKDDPIYRQCIPDERELRGSAELMTDPLGEDPHSPVPCVVHRYPDRCLLLVSDRCATYCRFCTRKRKFRQPGGVDRAHIDEGIAYIRQHSELRDVLVSGGDPLLLGDDELEYILRNLRAVEHVEIIRIGTRTPCVLPERITRQLCGMLKKYHPLYINVHFNHPRELTPQAVAALGKLADAGIPLGNQTVLLAGVNDDPAVMLELVRKLLAARVKPYYLHQTDLVYGTEHFRVPLKKGLEIMDALRGWTSGLGVPQYAIDLPGGGGKVTLVPEYCVERKCNSFIFRNYCHEYYEYPEITPPQPAPSAGGK